MSEDRLDALAAIAARGAEAGKGRMIEEQLPPALPDIRLPGPQDGDRLAFRPRPVFGPEELRLALDQARKDSAVFLQDLSPPLPGTRREVRVGGADWRLEPAVEWKHVALPHYGGPIGRARAWYRMDVTLDDAHLAAGSVWVCFGGVDYKAAVFWNGELAGTHEGFFSPFEFDVTRAARAGMNELLVRVDNDAIMHGNDSWDDARSGDKIYGATGLGWDEPGLGWHHCPPGMGIHRPVRVEARPAVHIADLFVRPLPGEEVAEAWVEVFSARENPVSAKLTLAVHGQNFPCDPIEMAPEIPAAGAGLNRFRVMIPLPGARRWSPEEPWLHRLHAVLESDAGRDARSTQFGMRSFQLDQSSGPDGRRGRFLLNGEPVRLRGANTMGHEQQCVFRGDLDQLRDDILLAKLANMNFLRFTQRPVEPEVYDMCDRLGLMAQSDLPLFARLRRSQFSEAVRQSAEMERLVRGHPSSVLVSFINEPFPAAWGDQSHRHLTRPELEDFFAAAARAIHVENPDRQIKPIDGDYEPPGPGLPDNHCYAGWYNGHGLDLGKIHKGFWLPVKPGWNYACGEFGSEGLDFEDVMREEYPAAWLPGDPAGESAWTPARIPRCQTGDHHHLWIEPGADMAQWIERSQTHQEWITRLMTEAFRRDNRMVGFAIHLFIDAWPAGWMKAIMDCRRRPKPAYFAYREALAPLAANLRLDRAAWYSGERFEAEAWVCNDCNEGPDGYSLAYQLELGGRVVLSGRAPARIRAVEAVFQGFLNFTVPEVATREAALLRLGILDANGSVIHDTAAAIDIFPRPRERGHPARIDGSNGQDARASLNGQHPSQRGAQVLGGAKVVLLAPHLPANWIICDDPRRLAGIHEQVAAGATAFLAEFPPGTWDIAGSMVRFEECGMCARHFVARDPDHPLARQFKDNDFRFWYDAALGRSAPLLETLFFADATWTPILRTGQGGWTRAWEPALAAAEKPHGKGRIILCQLRLASSLPYPPAAEFLRRLHGMPHGRSGTPAPALGRSAHPGPG